MKIFWGAVRPRGTKPYSVSVTCERSLQRETTQTLNVPTNPIQASQPQHHSCIYCPLVGSLRLLKLGTLLGGGCSRQPYTHRRAAAGALRDRDLERSAAHEHLDWGGERREVRDTYDSR